LEGAREQRLLDRFAAEVVAGVARVQNRVIVHADEADAAACARTGIGRCYRPDLERAGLRHRRMIHRYDGTTSAPELSCTGARERLGVAVAASSIAQRANRYCC